MEPLTVVGLVVGLVLLVAGAEWLVRGAARLARAVGLSQVVVGLTVVAYGTSAPELAVSVRGALTGDSDVALGNILGSNVFNVLLIIGVSALFAALVVHQRIVRIDVPLVIAATGVVWVMALDGRLGRVDGLLLLAGAITYTAWLVRASRRETAEVAAEYAEAIDVDPAEARAHWPRAVGLVALGIAALVLGARLLVDGAVAIAEVLGVSDLVIGLTVVAAGTSLPELATSAVAALRGERDIAVGNVVGSNLFNLLAVGGASAALAPAGIAVGAPVLAQDLPVALLAMLVVLPAFAIGLTVERWEGVLLIAAYVGYVAVLVATATGATSLGAARPWLFGGLIAVGVVLLVVGVLVARRARPIARDDAALGSRA